MVRFKDILEVVSDQRDVSIHRLTSTDTSKSIASARFEVCWIARELTNMSSSEIGFKLGERDHTTILHACQSIEKTLRFDETYADDMRELICMIQSHSNGITVTNPKSINTLHVARNIAMNESTIEVTPDEIRALANAVLLASGEIILTVQNPITHPTPPTHKPS